MSENDWRRGAAFWSEITDKAGNVVERQVLIYRWPPVRAAFRDDKGATVEDTEWGPMRRSSPEAGQIFFERFQRQIQAGRGKPADRVLEAMFRAPIAEVLKLHCGHCHMVAAFFLTWQGADSIESVLAEGRWVTSNLPSSCACPWTTWPDARLFRRQIATALGRGLESGHAAVKVAIQPS